MISAAQTAENYVIANAVDLVTAVRYRYYMNSISR